MRSRVTARPASTTSNARRSNSFGQLELRVRAPRAARGPVDGQVAGGERLARAGRRIDRGRAAQVRADAREELRQPERLDEVVVGAGIQSGDDVELLVACRDDEDGEVGAGVAQATADVDSVHVGEAEVEDDELDVLPGRGLGGAAARETPDAVALAVQDADEPGRDRLVVLHEQDVRPGHDMSVGRAGRSAEQV